MPQLTIRYSTSTLYRCDYQSNTSNVDDHDSVISDVIECHVFEGLNILVNSTLLYTEFINVNELHSSFRRLFKYHMSFISSTSLKKLDLFCHYCYSANEGNIDRTKLLTHKV